jgi:hypothetical protein
MDRRNFLWAGAASLLGLFVPWLRAEPTKVKGRVFVRIGQGPRFSSWLLIDWDQMRVGDRVQIIWPDRCHEGVVAIPPSRIGDTRTIALDVGLAAG